MKLAQFIVPVISLLCLLGAVKAEAFTGSYEETISVGDKSVAHFRVHSKDKKVRTEFLMEGQSEVIMRNDQGTFRYSAEQKVALKLPPIEDQPTLLDHLDDYQGFLQKNSAVKKGMENVDGINADIYEFLDPMTQKNARAWVWPEKGFPVKIEIEAPEGLLRVALKNIQIGGDVPDSLFEVPAETRILDVNEMYAKNAAAQAAGAPAPESGEIVEGETTPPSPVPVQSPA